MSCPACAGIPVWISWIRYISFVFYGFGLLLHFEYDGRTIYSCVNTAVTADAQMSAQVGGAGIPDVNLQHQLSLYSSTTVLLGWHACWSTT